MFKCTFSGVAYVLSLSAIWNSFIALSYFFSSL